jgi:hypothetical protein
MAGRWVLLPALALGGLWWWAVLRLALEPGHTGLESAVAAGGWGLSLLPVHAAASRRRRPGAALAAEAGATARAADTPAADPRDGTGLGHR